MPDDLGAQEVLPRTTVTRHEDARFNESDALEVDAELYTVHRRSTVSVPKASPGCLALVLHRRLLRGYQPMKLAGRGIERQIKPLVEHRLLGSIHGGLERGISDLGRNPLRHGLPEQGHGRLSRMAGGRESHELEHAADAVDWCQGAVSKKAQHVVLDLPHGRAVEGHLVSQPVPPRVGGVSSREQTGIVRYALADRRAAALTDGPTVEGDVDRGPLSHRVEAKWIEPAHEGHRFGPEMLVDATLVLGAEVDAGSVRLSGELVAIVEPGDLDPLRRPSPHEIALASRPVQIG